ncbi:MAG: hypothetical protein SF052_07110 [Bacteroidia bacterium]|nr:hypothetical protein [Bacteroidia bacterium]
MNNFPKTRGWKRRIRQLDQWLEKFKNPNIHELDEGFAEYVKIWIYPWFQLAKRNPPLWYFRLILDRFSLMYDHWQAAFRQSPHPHDLQLWIFEDNIIESELVCARVHKPGEFIISKKWIRSPQRKFKTFLTLVFRRRLYLKAKQIRTATSGNLMITSGSEEKM